LNVSFDPAEGAPVLSALAVHRAIRPDASGWQLVWQDEFDGDAIDDTRWTAERWPARKVNDEDQAYTARAENLRVEDGQLVIEARREAFGEAQYTSGRLHSAGKGDFLYGRFEVRARLPRGKGTWPAIWMLPSDPFRYATTCNAGEWQGRADCDAWPNSGEIDIMEHVGYQPGHVHATVHNQAYYWVTWEQRKGRVVLGDAADAFHVYALEWSPGRIDAFVDDTRYFTYVNEGEGWRSWPYDQPFHLILNLAVGGVWGRAGGGIDAEALPQQLRMLGELWDAGYVTDAEFVRIKQRLIEAEF
jgi:beta-glucanase (GH16 family)